MIICRPSGASFVAASNPGLFLFAPLRGLERRFATETSQDGTAQALLVAKTFIEMEDEMPGTYKITEVVGTSPVSFAEAVKSAVQDAGKTTRQMDWFEVVEMRGHIKEGNVDEFQVKIKVGHRG